MWANTSQQRTDEISGAKLEVVYHRSILPLNIFEKSDRSISKIICNYLNLDIIIYVFIFRKTRLYISIARK